MSALTRTELIAFATMLLKSYRHTKFSVVMLCASLLVAAAGLSAVLIINTSAKQSYANNTQVLINNVSHQVIAKPNSTLTKADYVLLRRQGFSELVAVAHASAHVYVGNTQVSTRTIDFKGIDSLALLATGSANQNDGAATPSLGLGQAGAIAHPLLIAQLHAAAKQHTSQNTLSFNVIHNDSRHTLPELVGHAHEALGNDIVLNIQGFYSLFKQAPLQTLLWIDNTDVTSNNYAHRHEQFKAVLPKHLSMVPISNTQNQGQLSNSFHMNLLAMALLMFVVCLFIVLNAVNLLLHSRMPWLKIYRQLGFARQTLFIVQLVEITILVSVSVLVGVVCGVELAKLASPTIMATLENLYRVQLGFGELNLLSLFAKVFAISWLGAIAAFSFPYSKINQRIYHMHSSSESKLQQKSFFIAFVILSIVAAYLLFSSSVLWVLLASTAMVILAGCALLLAVYPHLLHALAKIIPPTMPLLSLSAYHSAQLSSKMKIACCAFFIATTSNIGMNLMVDSFRGATQSWLDTRLAASHYLYYEGDKSISVFANEVNVQNAHDIPMTVTPRYELEQEYNQQPLQVYSYPTSRNFKQAMVFYEKADKAWQTFENDNGIMINQQMAFSMDISLGDTIELRHPSTNALLSMRVMGIVYDFGNPFNQVLWPLQAFDADSTPSSIYAIKATETQIAQFKKLLTSNDITHSKRLLTAEALLAMSMQAFDKTFVVTDGLNAVTLFVAALSLACALIVMMHHIKPHTMLLRSLGVSAIAAQLHTLFQFMLLCFVALICASPFGILLSYILIYVINYQAFNWTYPMIIDAVEIMQVYVVSLIVVLIVISIPLIKASKRSIIEDIRCLN